MANSEPLPNGTVIMADAQTAGRGQQGAQWLSQAGKNITASILLYPEKLSVSRQFALNRAVSIALCTALSEFSKASVLIKWPNDLFVSGRKLCGILIENGLKGSLIRTSVVGFGINVNQRDFPEGAGRPVSLLEIMRRETDRLHLLGKLCSAIEQHYLHLMAGEYETLHETYDALLYRKDQHSTFQARGTEFTGTITGTTADGCLKILTENSTQLFSAREVALLR